MRILYSAITYISNPWEEISFEDEKIICERRSKSSNPLEKYLDNPNFWKEVRQVYFYFESNNRKSIKDFYRKYGHIGTFYEREIFYEDSEKETRIDYEDIEEVKAHLDWFRVLTVITDALKNKKTAHLWELFRQAERVGKPKIVFMHKAPYGFNMLNIVLPYLEKGESWNPSYCEPETEDELYAAVWNAVDTTVEETFKEFLAPPFQSKGLIENKTLNLVATSALQAAFLQWFFQEITPLAVSQCQSTDCDSPVVSPRRTYCSEKCRQREKKRRQNERKRRKELEQ